MIVCNICGAIFLDMNERIYKEHLKYCEPIKIKRNSRRKNGRFKSKRNSRKYM
jgi:hypothetical protein